MLSALAPAGQPPIDHTIATGAALLVWCYCDGMVGRLNWGVAALAALLRLRLALAWVDFLFGSSLTQVGRLSSSLPAMR